MNLIMLDVLSSIILLEKALNPATALVTLLVNMFLGC